jgi:uncharacterized protein
MTESLSYWQRILRLGTTHGLACLLFLFAVSVGAAIGLSRLTLDVGSARFVPADDPDRQAHLRVIREFGSDHRSFVYVRDPALWTPEKLQALEQLHRDLLQLPFVERLDDIFTSVVARRVDGQLHALPLIGTLPDSVGAAEQLRAEVLADPMVVKNLISADGQAMVIGISIREGDRADSTEVAYRAIEGVLDPLRGSFKSTTQLGTPRIEAEIRSGLMSDVLTLVPASALLLIVTTFFFFRSGFAAMMPLLVGGLSLLWTFGLMGWVGIPISILSGMLPTITLVIGTTEIMRMISGYYRGLGASGLSKVASEVRSSATQTMFESLRAPAILTIVTTSIGFASNAFAGLAMVRDFGLAAAIAILANGLIMVLLVPLLYQAFGPLSASPRAFGRIKQLPAAAARAFSLMRHRFSLLALALASGLIFVFVQQAANLNVTNEPLTFFRSDRAVVESSRQMQNDIAGARLFYVTLESNAEGAFRDPVNIQRLADVQAFIAKQQIFDRSLSLADVISQANMAAAGGKPDAYRVPPTRMQVSRYLLLHSPRDLAVYVSHDFRRANIIVRHNVRDSSTLNHHVRELKQAVSHHAGVDMTTSIVGENLMINAVADRLVEGQALVFTLLLVIVFLVMSLMFTSIKGGIIALVPSVVPILMILGVMRLLEIPLNAATVMVVVVAIGIAIDGTVHLFSRYSELCRHATNYDEAVIDTVRDEAASVIAVGLALALGFGVLLLSDFTPIAQFGALAAATMLFSIFTNLLITPLVMSKIRLVGLYEILAMSKHGRALEHSPLFHGMTSYQIRKTILISELHDHVDGACLIEQGTIGRSMYIVVSGRLEVVRRDGGEDRIIATLGPGDVFGEIGFVRATHRTAEVRAVGAGSVLRFDHDRLEKDLVFFPHIMAKLNFNISGILGQRLVEWVEREHAK